MIPNVAHFVYGLGDLDEPFHFVHYLAVESCRRVVRPDAVYLHCRRPPWGPWWDQLSRHVTVVPVDLAGEVLSADYSEGLVPKPYRYAHHADFVRLDALLTYGGIYADIDTVFVRRPRPELYSAPFVIGAEPPVRDERTGEMRPSLCNALLMSEPGAPFARAWRDQMAGELNGTWSNHSGFLAQRLSEELAGEVHVEPPTTFFPFASDAAGLSQLFLERHEIPPTTTSVHLWAHQWWSPHRRDMSPAHHRWCTPRALRRARSTFAELARPYLPELDRRRGAGPPWRYLSLDEVSGYGVAADRCMDALEGHGIGVDWMPLVPGGRWGLSCAPPAVFDGTEAAGESPPSEVVVAHAVPEYFPAVRWRFGDAFVVGHTAWETDRPPAHWAPCLDAVDLVVVPSRFSAAALARSGSATPIEVVPHAAPSAGRGTGDTWAGIPDDLFVFYVVAEWNRRKAVDRTVEAYLRAFGRSDPVVLVVKTSWRDRDGSLGDGRGPVQVGTAPWAMARLLAGRHDPPAILLVTREVDDGVIADLHARADCYVSLARSEGWGLGAFDAAASGNPVVTTGFGGHLDFLGSSPYLVDYDLVPVDFPSGVPSYTSDQMWAEPDVDHAAALLRQVFTHRQDAASGAAALAEDIRWRFRPEAVAAAFEAAVQRHRLPVRPGP